jgi:hypothetical protein
LGKCKILHFDKLTFAKSEFVKLFFLFAFAKKVILLTFLFFYLQTFFCAGVGVGGTLCDYAKAFPGKEGGIQVLAGLAPSSQTVGTSLRTPWPAKSARKF